MARPTLSAAMRFIRNLMLACLAITACGCASEFPPAPNPLAPAEAQFNVPPKQMVETVRQVVSAPPLSLPVEVQDNGVLLTGFQRHPGEWHILRRWQEQTRYKISVIPDWEQPAQRCRVQVVDETQTRATDGQTWDPAPEVDRRDRSRQILDRIREAAPKS
jgi:hypothetical protein